MSSFAGLSVVTNGKHCTTTAIDAGMDSVGYHLLVVKDYLRTVQEVPNGQRIWSGHFMVGGHKWCISYCPNGEQPSCADFISLGLCLVDDDVEEPVKAKLVFSFVDQVEKQKAKEIFTIKSCSFSVKGCCWGPFKFMKRDALERSAHLKADCFTIRIDIMVCNDLTTQQDVVGTLSGIGQHFKILLQDKVGCDVTFEVSGETFLAHRCVLAARSKVFRAQFFGPMTQGITSSAIQIKDMDAKVFAAMLSFIYSDSFPEMEENKAQAVEEQEEEAAKLVTWMQDLFVASDRYDIQQLKFLCEKKLFNLIGVSSVACTLALAERHNCHGLKDACLTFIQVQSPKCLEKVMETDGWELIVTTYPSILKEIIAKVASNQKDKKRKYESM
ncbi:BTB/POZ and MATH domain-containing protein 2-like [Lolium perenne]|uniref:BTB/POZ and MATH domain-containing protein 2-like n=1 Tax=Lolium perenne TaxID=4522 RepID=UPI0021F56F5F|nr:BTB/POZ and MATH domain-containing protein 2-like [Lolium perenne]